MLLVERHQPTLCKTGINVEDAVTAQVVAIPNQARRGIFKRFEGNRWIRKQVRTGRTARCGFWCILVCTNVYSRNLSGIARYIIVCWPEAAIAH